MRLARRLSAHESANITGTGASNQVHDEGPDVFAMSSGGDDSNIPKIRGNVLIARLSDNLFSHPFSHPL
jgi:hypothetical protein